MTHGGATEGRNPDEGQHCGHQDHAQDELTNGASTGYSCDKHADKGRPRQPPAPIEHRPPALPAGLPTLPGGRILFAGVRPEAHLDDVREIIARSIDQRHDYVAARPPDEEEQDQGDGQYDVQLAEQLDAAIDPGHRREHGDRSNHCDQPQLHQHRAFQAQQPAQTGVDLLCAQAQRSGHAKDGCQDCQDVHRMPPGAVHGATKQRA
ncbi:hypothetical protein D3C84_660770 [compost metagenome]